MMCRPDRWYSRHFGFRRGRFFYYRMFVSEMVEWLVQGLTLNSLMSTKHVVYTELALLTLLLNVSISPMLFLLRRRGNVVRELLVLSDTLTDLMFLSLSFWFVRTQEDLQREVRVFGIVFPVWVTALLWPASNLLFRIRLIVQSFMTSLMEARTTRRKGQHGMRVSFSWIRARHNRQDADGMVTLSEKKRKRQEEEKEMEEKEKGIKFVKKGSTLLTRYAEVLGTLSIMLTVGGIISHALALIVEADYRCAHMAPAEALWWNAYPRIAVLGDIQDEDSLAPNVDGSGIFRYTNPLIQASACRYDKVKETSATDGALGPNAKSVPRELSYWTSLTALDLSHNGILDIPVEILDMEGLESVVLKGNPVQFDLNLSNSRGKGFKNGELPFRLRHLEFPAWDLALRSLTLSNTSLRSLPADMHKRMPCLKHLVLGQSDRILNPVQPSLYQLYYDFTRRNSSSGIIRGQCEEAAAAVSFHLVIQSTDAHREPRYSTTLIRRPLHWAYLAKPLSNRNRTGLAGEAVWDFLSVLNANFSHIQVPCSGLEVLDFSWLKSPQSLSLVELDLSSNDWDVSRWGTKTISVVDWRALYDPTDPKYIDWKKWDFIDSSPIPTLAKVEATQGTTIIVSELWESLSTLRQKGRVLERFQMTNASLKSDHFNIDQAVYIDHVLRASEFSRGFNVSWNIGVTDLHWDKLMRPYSPKPPLWLAMHLLPTLWSLDLRSNNYSEYNGNGGRLLQELCQHENIAYLYLQNAFSGKTSIPSCFWNIRSLEYFSISNDRNARRIANMLEGELPESLVHLPKLLSLHMCARAFCQVSDYPSTFSLMTGLLPELPSKFISLRMSGMSLHGELPAQWGTLTNFVHLELADMNITGSMSNIQFKRMPSLQRLILSRLQLSGEIPWSDLMQLKVLRILEQPNLRGRLFPLEFPESCGWVDVDIQNVGVGSSEIALPSSVQKCSSLMRMRVLGGGGVAVFDKTTVPRNICMAMQYLEYIQVFQGHKWEPFSSVFLVCDRYDRENLRECSSPYVGHGNCKVVGW